MKLIEVTVSPAGENRIETRGIAGAECREATRALEAALGLCSGETLTAEFYTPSHQEQGLAARSDGPA